MKLLKRRPLISVIIPLYNAEKFLAWTLESVKNQTLKNFECLIVNDGSTDSSAEIALKFVRADRQRFRLLRHACNSGPSASRNTAIRAALGEFICFLDSDDLMMPESLEKRVAAIIEANNEFVAGSYCGSLTINNSVRKPPAPAAAPQLRAIDFLTTAGNCPFNANQPMIRTSVLRAVGGFNEQLFQAEDYDTWMRILRSGYMFVPVNETLVTYRTTEGSTVREEPLKHLDNSMKIFSLCHTPLPAEDRPARAAMWLPRAWVEYKQQLDIFNRVMEFSGMALAKSESSEKEIVRFINRALPDATGFLARHRDPRQHLLNGARRQLPGKWSEQVEKDMQSRISSLLKKISDAAKDEYRQSSPDAYKKLNEVLEGDFHRFSPWFPGRQKKYDIIFLPHKDYHVWTIGLILPALKERGISAAIVDLSGHYRDEGVRAKAKELGLEIIGFGNLTLGEYRPKLLVSFNDWDPIVRSIFFAAQQAGITTAAIVEGIQDYDDVDVGRIRRAYKMAEHVLLPGEFDKKYFKESKQKLHVVGLPRIQELCAKTFPAPSGERSRKTVLINSNFSYGVLEDARDSWVEKAVRAARSAGMTPVITRHPADKGTTFPELVTDKSFYDAVIESDVVVQRFASGILEALAMKRPVVYFNPHNEKVDKFKFPEGAYHIANSEDELAALLKSGKAFEFHEDKVMAFLNHHAGAEGDSISAHGEALFTILQEAGNQNADYDKFRHFLQAIDIMTMSYTDIHALRDMFIVAKEKGSSAGKPFNIHKISPFNNKENHEEIMVESDFFNFKDWGKDLMEAVKMAQAINGYGDASMQEILREANYSLSRFMNGKKKYSSFRRKMNKLRNNPYSFFSDSRFAALKALASLFKR